MKALILDGSRAGDTLTPAAVLGMSSALSARGAQVDVAILRMRDIAPCAGCFGCWTKTPGECVIADDARDVVCACVRSDVVVYATPVTFGGYSSQLKAIVDRLLPVLDPRFAVVGGEVHHRLRYPRYPKILCLGTLPSPDLAAERLFARLAARNGLNLHRACEADVLAGAADPEAARRVADALLDRAGVPG